MYEHVVVGCDTDTDMFCRELVDPVTCTLCTLFEKPSMRKYLRPDYEICTLLRDFFEPNMPGGTVNELPSYDFSRRYVNVLLPVCHHHSTKLFLLPTVLYNNNKNATTTI